jgi:LytR cell envelope-related transcriptional attenuator
MGCARAGGRIAQVAQATVRRPLPALAFMFVLALLTAFVWWRVINRADQDNKPAAQASCSSASTVTTVPQPTAVTVDVLNATPRNGLAASTSETLRKDGFEIDQVANDTPGVSIPDVGEIRYGPSAHAAATLVALYFPGAKLVQISRTDDQVVISLGAKFTAVASPATVKQLMASRHIVQQPVVRAGPLVQTPTTSGSASASC